MFSRSLYILCLFIITIPVVKSQPAFKVLVFTKTAGFQHSSIPDGISAITDLGLQHNFDVDHTNDASFITTANLSDYAAVVFLNTTGDVLNATQENAFENFIQSGGGFVGVHSATDTEYNWPWYGGLIGNYFVNHPAVQNAILNVTDTNHLSTVNFPDPWQVSDEWYNFSVPFPPHLNVLITVDENSYSGGTMGNFHPISWYHHYDGGRSFYTAMGHTSAVFYESEFRQHLLGGILWAANQFVNINTFENHSYEIFTELSNDNLNITTLLPDLLNIEIYDINARKIYSSQLRKNHNINISDWSKGIYLIHINDKNINYSKKLIKR